MIDEKELMDFFNARVEYVQSEVSGVAGNLWVGHRWDTTYAPKFREIVRKEIFYWTKICYISAVHMGSDMPSELLHVFLGKQVDNLIAFQRNLLRDFLALMEKSVAKKRRVIA